MSKVKVNLIFKSGAATTVKLTDIEIKELKNTMSGSFDKFELNNLVIDTRELIFMEVLE